MDITLMNKDVNIHNVIVDRAEAISAEQCRVICPYCSPTRKKKKEKTLSVKKEPDKFVYQCHHCGESGVIREMSNVTYIPKPKTPLKLVSTNNGAFSFLKERGISQKTIDHFNVFECNKYFPKHGEQPAIGYPYKKDGEDYAVKYRCTAHKSFTQDGGGANSFFGLQHIEEDAKEICIVEGELDALTLYECGYENVVSVPGGAPIKVKDNKIDPKEDKKFSYLWESEKLLQNVDKIILAVDNDAQGSALAEEIARRVGKPKCFMVEYPKGCKDGNDVLQNHGKETLHNLIMNPKPWPIVGLYDVDHYDDKIEDLYENGTAKGESTGFETLDKLFTICLGQLSVVTGHPSSGKSEFVDAMMVNLAEQKQWKFAICSFENDPPTHSAKLMEKRARLPFFDGPNEKMTKEEMKNHKNWVKDHFIFLDQNDGEPSTINSILERTKIAILRKGIRGLVIDPYNFIQIDKQTTETDAISEMLTRVRLFAKANDIHVWFVAHPAKMLRDGTKVPPPKGYDISGSAAWFAKADLGITVHRNDYEKNESEVHVWKCRFKWVGQQGMGLLKYNKVDGTYSSISIDF